MVRPHLRLVGAASNTPFYYFKASSVNRKPNSRLPTLRRCRRQMRPCSGLRGPLNRVDGCVLEYRPAASRGCRSTIGIRWSLKIRSYSRRRLSTPHVEPSSASDDNRPGASRQITMRSISSSVTVSAVRSYSFVVLGDAWPAICCAYSSVPPFDRYAVTRQRPAAQAAARPLDALKQRRRVREAHNAEHLSVGGAAANVRQWQRRVTAPVTEKWIGLNRYPAARLWALHCWQTELAGVPRALHGGCGPTAVGEDDREGRSAAVGRGRRRNSTGPEPAGTAKGAWRGVDGLVTTNPG